MDLSLIVNKLENLSECAADGIKKTMDEMDADTGLNDPSKTIKLQFLLNNYSNFTNYGSSMVKIIRDLIGGIISKL